LQAHDVGPARPRSREPAPKGPRSPARRSTSAGGSLVDGWCALCRRLDSTPAGGALVNGWVTVCRRLYRRAARTFPYEFRAVCGDGLEQLGEDVVPLVWQQQCAVGMIRLFADLAMRL